MAAFRLRITTPERVLFEGEVSQVSLPTPQGEITVLPHHIPLVSLLAAGELRYHAKEEIHHLAVSGGFIEMRGETLTVLADTAERADEIDEVRAEEARKRAEALMQEKRTDAEEFANLAAQMEKELARLRVVRKYRHRGHQGITQEGVRKE